MPSVTALSDAAILYGAQRYYDGLHDDEGWPYRGQYRKEDDRALFIELLHNLCLYDRIVLDNRPIENAERLAYNELSRFTARVNDLAAAEVFSGDALTVDYAEQAQAGASATGDVPTAVQHAVCRLVASYVASGKTSEMEAVAVPWAYHQAFHQDRRPIANGLQRLRVDEGWIPFTLFVWRAVWYGAIARFQARRSRRPFAYVAAPRRIATLRALFDAKTLAAFQFPREAVREVSWELPGIPAAGYDFGFLDFVSPFEASGLSQSIDEMSPDAALVFVMNLRESTQAKAMRADWADILLEGASTCAVGTTVVQIMRDMTVNGTVNQTVRLRAVPAENGFERW